MKHLFVLFSLLLFSTGSAFGIEIKVKADNVVSGFSNCTVTKTGSNAWQASFSIDWLEMSATPPLPNWGSRTGRGFLIFLYDSSGKAIKTYLPRDDISMNGYRPGGAEGNFTYGNSYLAYGFSNGWDSFSSFSANIAVQIKQAKVAIVAMYPINVYSGARSVYEQTGAIYFALSQATSNCQLMTNPNTPPVIVNLTMNAPDWDLGEIATGQQQKVMTNNADRLCISYLSTESAGKDFIVNATNANGIVNNRFILKHSLNPTNTLPYTLTLDNMGKQIRLPNTDNSSIRFEDSGNQTCFTPTFDLYGNDDQELGDYTDVITYEIVTKS